MTVSVVIPHWNRCTLLEQLLDSLHEQDLPPECQLEVLVVDNGSTDQSIRTARERGAEVLCLGRNEGVSRAINRGIEASRGEYIALEDLAGRTRRQ
jgi:glycosyltransferase involved in cell wall biosynthesis